MSHTLATTLAVTGWAAFAAGMMAVLYKTVGR